MVLSEERSHSMVAESTGSPRRQSGTSRNNSFVSKSSRFLGRRTSAILSRRDEASKRRSSKKMATPQNSVNLQMKTTREEEPLAMSSPVVCFSRPETASQSCSRLSSPTTLSPPSTGGLSMHTPLQNRAKKAHWWSESSQESQPENYFVTQPEVVSQSEKANVEDEDKSRTRRLRTMFYASRDAAMLAFNSVQRGLSTQLTQDEASCSNSQVEEETQSNLVTSAKRNLSAADALINMSPTNKEGDSKFSLPCSPSGVKFSPDMEQIHQKRLKKRKQQTKSSSKSFREPKMQPLNRLKPSFGLRSLRSLNPEVSVTAPDSDGEGPKDASDKPSVTLSHQSCRQKGDNIAVLQGAGGPSSHTFNSNLVSINVNSPESCEQKSAPSGKTAEINQDLLGTNLEHLRIKQSCSSDDRNNLWDSRNSNEESAHDKRHDISSSSLLMETPSAPSRSPKPRLRETLLSLKEMDIFKRGAFSVDVHSSSDEKRGDESLMSSRNSILRANTSDCASPPSQSETDTKRATMMTREKTIVG